MSLVIKKIPKYLALAIVSLLVLVLLSALSYRKFLQYKAAQKEIVWFEGPGHFPFYEDPQKIRRGIGPHTFAAGSAEWHFSRMQGTRLAP